MLLNVSFIVGNSCSVVLYHIGNAIAFILVKQPEHFPLGKQAGCHYVGNMFFALPLQPLLFYTAIDFYRDVVDEHRFTF